MKTMQQMLQETYLGMQGILSEEDNQVITDILALDELSKATLGKYIKVATKSRTKMQGDQDSLNHSLDSLNKHYHNVTHKMKNRDDSDEVRKSFNNIEDKIRKQKDHLSHKDDNRATGIHRAIKKLTKEDVEQAIEELVQEVFEDLDESVLNELSKKTLGSYINKAAGSVRDDSRDAGFAFGTGKFKGEGEKVNKRALKRLKGITKATSRLTKEQKELIGSILDEISEEFESLDESKDDIQHGDRVMVHAPGYKHHGKTGKVIDSSMNNDFHTIKFGKDTETYHYSDLKRVSPR